MQSNEDANQGGQVLTYLIYATNLPPCPVHFDLNSPVQFIT